MNRAISKEQVTQIILVSCCAALVGAWIAEYVFGLSACSLCLYQRYFYMSGIAVLAIGLFVFSGRYQNLFLIFSSMILLLCAFTAGYQVAVENKWVELPKICAAPELTGTFEEMKEMITTKAHVACDRVEWSLFGLSLAAYNLMYALGLAFFGFMGIFIDDKKKKKFTRR